MSTTAKDDSPTDAAPAQGEPGLLARFFATHLWRTWDNHGQRRGAVLASGMAYAALFSVFGALATGFSVFALVLGSNTGLYNQVVAAVDAALPGLLDVGSDGGAITPRDLVQSNALSWTGAVAFAATIYAGLGWLDAAREGIRAMFDVRTLPLNIVFKKIRDLGVMLTLGLVLVLSAVLSLAVGAAADPLLRLVGLDGSPVAAAILWVLSLLVVLLVDVLVFVVLFRLLSGLDLSLRDLRTGVIIGAVGLGILQRVAGQLLGMTGNGNPLLATGAVLVGLLVWLNLVSRVTLLAASWVATTVHEKGVSLVKTADAAAVGGPAHAVYGSAGRPVTLGPRELVMPTFSTRAADRTTFAAGIVLGGVLLGAARVVVTGAATAVRAVTGHPSD
jgi:membrane protein